MDKLTRRKLNFGVWGMVALLAPLCLDGSIQSASAAEINIRDPKSIQVAIDNLGKAGGRVTIPPGTYEIDSTLLVGSNVTLEGAGASTIIKGSNKFDVATDIIANKNREGDNHISIQGLQVTGNWVNSGAAPWGFSGGAGINLRNVRHAIIRDVTVRDCPGSGVRVSEASQHITIDNVTSENNAQGVGVHGRPQDINIINSLLRRNANGIFLYSEGGVINNVRIANNRIIDHLFDDGIKIFGVVNYQITGNLIDGAAENGIEVHNIEGPGVTSGHFIISNNIIRNVDDGYNGGSNGIGINLVGPNTAQQNYHPVTDFVISNNLIENTMFGFVTEMRKAGKGVFSGNYVSNAAKGGMHILRTENFNVTGNVFADTGNYKSVEGYETFGIQITDVKDSNVSNNIIMDTRKDSKYQQEYGMLFRHGTNNVSVANNVIADVQKPMGFLYGSDAFLDKNLVVTNGVTAYLERGRAVPIADVVRTSREESVERLQKLSSQLRQDYAGLKGLGVVDFYEAIALNSAGNHAEAQKRFPDASWGNFRWQGAQVNLNPRKDQQEIRARRLDGIKLDGRFDEAAWKKADWQNDFVEFRSNNPVEEKTAVAVGYDNDNLYVAFSNQVTPKNLVAREMDNVDNVWGDDNVEFFIAPREGRADTYQFIVNPLGAFYDAFNQSAAWQSDMKVAVGVGVDCWNVEIAIPLKSLSDSPNRNGWKINFNSKSKSYRDEAGQVWGTWSYVDGANTNVARYGHLRFE